MTTYLEDLRNLDIETDKRQVKIQRLIRDLQIPKSASEYLNTYSHLVDTNLFEKSISEVLSACNFEFINEKYAENIEHGVHRVAVMLRFLKLNLSIKSIYNDNIKTVELAKKLDATLKDKDGSKFNIAIEHLCRGNVEHVEEWVRTNKVNKETDRHSLNVSSGLLYAFDMLFEVLPVN